jgi:hypothetical protein
MPDLETIHEQIEKERAKVAKLTQQDARAGSHLGFQQKPAIAFAPSRESSQGSGEESDVVGEELESQGSDTGSEAELDQPTRTEPPDAASESTEARKPSETDGPQASTTKAVRPARTDFAVQRKPLKAVPKIGANLGDAHFERLRQMLEGTAPTRARTFAPPPVAEIVAKKYVPIVELLENAFDCLQAWAIRIKNWKMWTLLMDQYGLPNTFRMPAQGACPIPPNFRDELNKAVTERSSMFPRCPVLLCKQQLFFDEVHQVIQPWGRTNFSTPLIELGQTLSALIRAIPGGKKEHEPPQEVLEFIEGSNAAEDVYNGASPVFNAEMSRQLSERITLETITVKRAFMDTALLKLKRDTDEAYRTLANLHSQCNAKREHCAKLDEVQDLYRAMEWQHALLRAYDAISKSVSGFHWVE